MKIKTNWDLSQLYKSNDDPQIEKDLREIEAAYDGFAEKYSGREDYLKDEKKLAEALADNEKLLGDFAADKPILYFYYKRDLNSKDSEAEAKSNILAQRMNKLENKLVFFGVALAKITGDNQKKFLASKVLAPYRYFLQVIFNHAKHVLSEAEEKILNLKSLPAHSLWVNGNEKLLGKQIIKWRGKSLSLAEAISKSASLPTKERRVLAGMVNAQLRNISDFAENELNAVVIDKKINDELRGYAEPYSAAVLNYQNEEATVDNLVKTVTKHFPLAHRFYKLKAKMLGLKSLTYADRSAQVGKTSKKIPFEQAVEITRQAFHEIDPIYSQTFDQFLQNGQIDAFPKPGKQGGAYCSSANKMPTFVLLNHVPDMNSVKTMAHEMGHAFHSKFSLENQSPLYRRYTTAVAEVASTFFENFVFDHIFQLLTPKEQIIALHDRINSSIATIFRQIACFNFELELHRQIREQGSLPKEEIAKLMNKHMAAYLGPTFKLSDDDGYFFVYWSHLRRFFYVYSYAFGELISDALYSMYKKDKKFEAKIRQFLSAGGSASPEDIFAQIGVDVRKPEFFETGLKKIEEDIDKLERLIK